MSGYDRLLVHTERQFQQRETAIRNQFRVLIEIPFEQQASADFSWNSDLIEDDLARHRSGQKANLAWFDGYQALPHLLTSSVGLSDEEFLCFFPYEEIDFQPAGIVNPYGIAWSEAISFALDCVKQGLISAYGYFGERERLSRLDPAWFGRDQSARVYGFSDTWFLPNPNKSPDHAKTIQPGETSTGWESVAAECKEWNLPSAKNGWAIREIVSLRMSGDVASTKAGAELMIEKYGVAPRGKAKKGMIVSSASDPTDTLSRHANKILNLINKMGLFPY